MTKVIYNGKIYLGGNGFREALIAEDGRIVKTGLSRDILEEAPRHAEKIDSDGALVIPAFYDSHLHLMWVGRRARGIECVGAKSVEEIIRRGRETISRLNPAPGVYIQGAGVNPDLFDGEKRDLCREDLDKVSPEHPVILSRHCGHTVYCNSLALRLAGLSEAAPEVPGGTVEKDAEGRPTGVFRENAASLVKKPMPAYTREDMKAFLLLGMEKAQEAGISACGSYDSGGEDFEKVVSVYRGIYDERKLLGKPGLRVSVQCGVSAREDILEARIKDFLAAGKTLWEDPLWGCFLKARSFKLFSDGTLGGHTAWMKKPYKDKSETGGFPVLEQEVLNKFVRKADAAGAQVLVHAIGDAGIDAAIKAFLEVTSPGRNPLRHGIVHCQITTADLLERMARNNILALAQPAFLADDIHILESRVGAELASTSYAWGSMERLGIEASFGSDAPVSGLGPLFGIEWAVLRRNSEDPLSKSFCAREKVGVRYALDAYTAAAAFSAFDENCLGRAEPGYFADLVFLDRDIFTIPPEDIHKTKVLRTMCAGETVYKA